MAKFKGFNPDQKFALLLGMGYKGPKSEREMDDFIQSSPTVASKMKANTANAEKRISKKNFAAGGMVVPDSQWNTQRLLGANAADKANVAAVDAPSFTKSAQVEKVQDNAANYIDQSVGKQEAPDKVDKQGATPVSTAATPADLLAQQAKQQGNTTAATANVPTDLKAQEAAQQAATKTGQATTQTPLTAQQVSDIADITAQQATTPDQYNTSKVDPTLVGDRAKEAISGLKAATADPTKKASVQEQLAGLMKDFDEGTPPWAAGAMRQAMGAMQARGLGASSMAGAAVVQAAMEAALPIATQDARTQAEFEMQNLNNEQQTTIFKTQQMLSAMFTDQAQENAAKQFNASSENQTKQFFANLQATASQFNAAQVNAIMQFNKEKDLQVSTFNAGEANRMGQFNTATAAETDRFNVGQSNAMSQFDSSQRQAIELFNSGEVNDMSQFTAAQRAAIEQFNAGETNRLAQFDSAQRQAIEQFNSGEVNDMSQFTASQRAAIQQFNAGQTNQMSQFDSTRDTEIDKFNTQIDAQRDQFNAQNSLVIAQANAQWRQNLTTFNTQQQNTANIEYARAANSLTSQALDAIWQKERDTMAFAFAKSESEKDRQLQLVMGNKDRSFARSQSNREALGYITGKVLGGLF